MRLCACWEVAVSSAGMEPSSRRVCGAYEGFGHGCPKERSSRVSGEGCATRFDGCGRTAHGGLEPPSKNRDLLGPRAQGPLMISCVANAMPSLGWQVMMRGKPLKTWGTIRLPRVPAERDGSADESARRREP